ALAPTDPANPGAWAMEPAAHPVSRIRMAPPAATAGRRPVPRETADRRSRATIAIGKRRTNRAAEPHAMGRTNSGAAANSTHTGSTRSMTRATTVVVARTRNTII